MIGGLIPLAREWISLDFSFSEHFGKVDLKDIPDEFLVAEPLEIKDQGHTDMCPAYSVTSVMEDYWQKLFEPGYSFAKMKQLLGGGYGADPRTACKTVLKFGTLEKSKAPYNLQQNGRDFVADPKNWNWADPLASDYKQDCYFYCDGYDLFDSIRSAMWKMKDERRSVVVGTYWDPKWNILTVIPKEGQGTLAHMFAVKGTKVINDEVHLVCQLSGGKQMGDNGMMYFPRQQANKFLFAYIFAKADSEEVKQKWSMLQKIKYFYQHL